KIFATINQTLDVKLAEEISREFGASTNKISFEEESTQDIELAEEERDLVRRSPIVRPAALHNTSALITSRRTAEKSFLSILRATRRSPACVPAAQKSPILWCSWWRRTTASCLRRSKPSITQKQPECLCWLRSTKSTSPAPSRIGSSSSFPIADCWRKTGAAIPSWCPSRPKPNRIWIS